MRYHEYVAECLRQASSGKLKTAELWAGIIAFVFAAIAYFWRPLGEIMSWLPAAAFFIILFLVFVFGLARAPFLIYKQQDDLCGRLQARLDERGRRQRVVDKLAHLTAECLQLLMRKVDCNDGYISWKQEIEDWYKRAQAEIKDSLGYSELVLFLTVSAAPVLYLFVQPFNETHQQDLQFFGARYHQLRTMISDMSTQLR